jgi:hypothetical protein
MDTNSSFSGVHQSGRKPENSRPSIAQVKNKRGYASTATMYTHYYGVEKDDCIFSDEALVQ